MQSFDAQIARIRREKATVLLSDVAAQEAVTDALERYLRGERNDRQVRFDLEKIIREAYRTSARAAMEVMRFQAERNRRWAPVPKDLVTPTMERLIADVRRNLRTFKESDREPTDARRAIVRFRLSATTAAQAGFSEGQRLSALELLAEGEQVRKFWGANFYGNEPCDRCVRLHGVEVGLDDVFPTYDSISTYGPLYGPPLHPNCRCDALYIVVQNGNRDDVVDLGEPTEPTMISSATIKRMPVNVFKAVIGALSRALALLRKAARL